MTFSNRTTQKLLLLAVVSSLVLLSCGGGGGSSIAEGSLCDTVDAVGQTAENIELTCQLMGDGKLVWRPAGGEITVAQAVGKGDCDKS